MPIKSDYISGTLTITQGSTAFTGTGTGWQSAEFREGDTLIDITGATEYMGVIEAITGEASGTLTKPWEGPSLVNVPYRMRYQPDGARSTAQARNLIEILGNGNITAFALLNGAANLLPMFTGPGAMTLVTRQALVSGAAYDVQVATLADRAAYDGQDQGYAVLVSNVGDGRAAIYSKNSATSGDWSDPAYITGAVGPVVQIEAGTTTTLEMGQPATVVVRPITDGYALDFGIPRGPQGDDGANGADGAVGATGPRGEGLSIDATGTLADRDNYDNELDGFTFVDTENGNLYFKDGDTPGVWSDPIPFGKGEKGDPGDSGAVIVTTNGVGNGTAGPYTLTEAPISTSATWASISGVTQYDFTLSGNQITFGIIVEAGIPWQVKSSGVLSVVEPADGSVGASKINTGEAAGIRTAINAAAKPATATAGNLAVFDANREVQDTGISKSTTAQAQAGTNDTNYMTPLKTAQAILALSPPTDVSGLYSSVSALALSLADLQGSRLLMNGGVADPFDDESGIYLGVPGGNDSNTRLLLHFNGANASTTFTDSSSSAKTATVFGNTQISTSQSVFGGASVFFDGTGDYLTYAANADWNFGTSDFTVDMRIRANTLAGGSKGIWGRTQDANNYMDTDVSTTGVVRWAIVAGGSALMNLSSPAGEIVAGQWYALAFERAGNVFRIYKDGAIIATTTLSITFPSYTGGFEIGRNSGNNNQQFNGWMDEFRVSNGIARFNGVYTPRSSEYTGFTGGSENQVYDAALDLYRPTQISPLIPQSTGTIIGDLTSNPNGMQNINRAFDGITSQSYTHSAVKYEVGVSSSNQAFIGKNFTSSPKRISSARAFGTIDNGLDGTTGASAITINLRAKNGSAPTDRSDGTLLGTTGPTTDGNGIFISVNSSDLTTLWDYVWMEITTNAGLIAGIYVAEAEFYESIISNMTLISTPYPSTAVPTQGRLVVQLDTPLTLVSGDFDGAISRDGGTTWINTPLTLTGTVGTIKTYESLSLVDFTGPTGSSLLFRVRTLTNKNIPVSGVVMQWK